MQVSNFKIHTIPFEEYLQLAGTSYSSIKEFKGKGDATSNGGMALGTKVHNYILEPEKYCWQDASMVREIARELRGVLGDTLKVLDKEVAFTADFTHNGMVMPYKGRTDLLKAGRIVVDLKILAGSLEPAIKLFGYEDQISGYCLATQSPVGLIIAYNKYTKKVERKVIQPKAEFWEYQTAHRGIPAGK